MKKIFTFFISLVFTNLLSAQVVVNCGSNRYDEEVFTSIDTTNDVVFGSNVTYQGSNMTLTMDIYQPSGDTAMFRPLIVWVHGGSFVGGSKVDNDVVGLCQHFAMRGYVCASINYRLGITFPYNQANATKAVFRGVQDMKAAIRFFRQDAATTNNYHIDPDMIFGGGSSAGAFCALHLAYLDEPSELPSSIDTTVMGGMEGNSGNPGYSSKVKAVLNLCGAMGDTAWMKPGDIPVCSMHGTNDQVVPYNTAMLYLLGAFPIMVVNGSYSVNEHAMLIGNEQSMYTYYGSDHVPYSSSTAYMDTTVRFVSNFLYRQLGCTPRDPNPVANTWNTVSVNDVATDADLITVAPNPASDYINLSFSSIEKSNQLSILNILGQPVYAASTKEKMLRIETAGWKKGVYFIKVQSGEETIVSKLLIN